MNLSRLGSKQIKVYKFKLAFSSNQPFAHNLLNLLALWNYDQLGSNIILLLATLISWYSHPY